MSTFIKRRWKVNTLDTKVWFDCSLQDDSALYCHTSFELIEIDYDENKTKQQCS